MVVIDSLYTREERGLFNKDTITQLKNSLDQTHFSNSFSLAMISPKKDNPHIVHCIFFHEAKSYSFCGIRTSIINNHHLFNTHQFKYIKLKKMRNAKHILKCSLVINATGKQQSVDINSNQLILTAQTMHFTFRNITYLCPIQLHPQTHVHA